MNYIKEFSEIVYLLGYFHQYYVVFYNWRGNEPTFQPLIRYFKTHNGIEITEKLITEIDRFLSIPLNNGEFETIMIEELGCEYTPRSQDLNKRQFLEQSLEILKEPMEETKKHFIPEFIG